MQEAQAGVEAFFANYTEKDGFVRAAHELGWEFVKEGDYETALQIYKGLQERFPEHQRAVWFQRSIVQTYLQKGDKQKAAQAVEKLITDYQSHPDYANQMKITADRLRYENWDGLADSIDNHLLNDFADSEQAVAGKRVQIQEALNSGNMEKTKTEVEEFFSKYSDNPGFVRAAHELGWEFVMEGDYETALRIYNGLLEKFPEHERAVWFQRSVVQTYLEKGDMEKALQAAEQMKKNFQSHPDYTNQMEELGERFIWHEEFEAARDVCQSLLDKFPNHKRAVWFSHYKARSEVAMKDKAAADATVRTMRQQYSESPDYADALSWTAHHYSEEGFHERGIELYEAALATEPNKEIQLRCREGIIAYEARVPKNKLLEAIENGEDKEVERIITNAVSEFSNCNEGLDQYLNELAIECFEEGEWARAIAEARLAKDYFEWAVKLWDRLLEECPDSSLRDSGVIRNVNLELIRSYQELEAVGEIKTIDAAKEIRRLCNKYLSDFPESRHTDEVKDILKRWDFIYTWLLSKRDN